MLHEKGHFVRIFEKEGEGDPCPHASYLHGSASRYSMLKVVSRISVIWVTVRQVPALNLSSWGHSHITSH